MDVFTRRVQGLQSSAHTLRGIRRGIEKESLRVTPDGKLAQTSHPAALGSAFKHPNITTDFSEALLEFITPACLTIDEAMAWLNDIHAYTYSVLKQQDEKLWVASMPCILGGDDSIPLAQYGTTHAARMKTVYREGLGNRYGRMMQTIAGIHYNISFPDELWHVLQEQDGDAGSLQDFKTRRYFGLIRNFRRFFWLLLYLFGASPALCPTFVQGRQHQLQAFDDRGHSLYLPQATSLRMGDLGYQSNAQSSMMVCYNSLQSYIATIRQGLTTPYAAYQKIGVRDAAGHYHQLSTNLLQIENEFYSTIRPKRVTRSGETPILALHDRGVEYVEVRCLDLNPYLPLGIDTATAQFIESFMLWCLLCDSPLADPDECHRLARNQRRVVEAGRDPSLLLEDAGDARTLPDWAGGFMDELAACAALLDKAYGGSGYADSLALQQSRLQDSSLTPSATVLRDMREQQKSFFRLSSDLSAQHAGYFGSHLLSAGQQAYFEDAASLSWRQQRELEAQATSETFEQYLQRYYAQYDRV